MLAAFGDTVFQRFNDWAPATVNETAFYLATAEQARRAGDRIELAIVPSDRPDHVLGGVSLHDVNQQQGRADVGYWLAAAERGKGEASRAVRLLADWAFTGLGLARLEVTCGPDNDASQNVAARCGFSREGILRSHVPFKGGRRDSVLFSLLPGELT